MEEQLKDIKTLIDKFSQLLEKYEELQEECEQLKKRISDIENDRAKCLSELNHIREIKDKAIKKVEKVLSLIDEVF